MTGPGAAPQQTYRDAYTAGDADIFDIDVWVDRWHNAPDGSWAASVELHTFLGFTESECQLWSENPASLTDILADRA